MFYMENDLIRLGFDAETGALSQIFCKPAQTEFVCHAADCVSPFAVWYDFHTDYQFRDHRTPGNPADFASAFLGPARPVFTRIAGGAKIDYALSDDLSASLTVRLEGIAVRMHLCFQNTGKETVSFLPAFPCLDHLSFPADARMLGVNQAGAVDQIWHYPGGVYGNAMDQTAQLGCLFTETVCLGFYLEDDSFCGKEIRYEEPALQVRYFPEKKLAPGQTQSLPDAVLMIYQGTWHETVQAYGDWFRANFAWPSTDHMPQTERYSGIWFEKKGKPNSPTGPAATAIDSFTELPNHFQQLSSDVLEYAFVSSLSAAEEILADPDCCGALRRHTDGVNIVRTDLGGVEALREGIHRAQKAGKRVVLYVEGLIVPLESTLFQICPDAKNWLYQNADGSNDGPYTHQGWLHMCCGCAEWQDHLADMCVRLIRETDADGIRLDSFSFYHWPCYNPAHHHKSPFDCNQWMQELLSKVSNAVRQVKPNAILTTEAAVDFDRLYMNMALDQYFDADRIVFALEGCSVFRVLFPTYYIPRINGGPIYESMLLMPDGCGRLDAPSLAWRAGVQWAGSLWKLGTVQPDPMRSLPDAYCRMITSADEAQFIGCRPVLCQDGTGMRVELAADHPLWHFSASVPFQPESVSLFDLESQQIQTPVWSYSDSQLQVQTSSNWFICRCFRNRPLEQ